MQGLGGALLEHLVYDEQGQLLTGSLADYLLPTASDFPHLRAFVMDEHPSPNNPLGAKGAGEGGLVGAGGVIANAVANALQSFDPDLRELPAHAVARLGHGAGLQGGRRSWPLIYADFWALGGGHRGAQNGEKSIAGRALPGARLLHWAGGTRTVVVREHCPAFLRWS